ncbi:MAG: AAA family ATPase, partial [Clostridia bacterium]|nr:AAA family ATPase [Clostridia bacterium]
RLITENKSLGFAAGGEDTSDRNYTKIKADVMGELKKTFKPEFLNRIDDIIVFTQLDREEIKHIAAKMLETLKSRLKENEIDANFTDSALEQIASVGFDPTYGARPLRRSIQSDIEDMLAEKMLEGTVNKGDTITVDFSDGTFTVSK